MNDEYILHPQCMITKYLKYETHLQQLQRHTTYITAVISGPQYTDKSPLYTNQNTRIAALLQR